MCEDQYKYACPESQAPAIPSITDELRAIARWNILTYLNTHPSPDYARALAALNILYPGEQP